MGSSDVVCWICHTTSPSLLEIIPMPVDLRYMDIFATEYRGGSSLGCVDVGEWKEGFRVL